MPAPLAIGKPCPGLLMFTAALMVPALLRAQQFEDRRVTLTSNVRPYDVDRDGLPDLLDLTSNGALSMRRNLGNLQFAPPQPVTQVTSAAGGLVAPSDLDGDGDTDFLLCYGGTTGNTTLQLAVARQQAPNVFALVPIATVPVPGSNYPVGLVPVDFDGDGDLDVVASSTAPNGVNHYALRNDGALLFTDTTLARFLGVQIPAAAGTIATDIDGDGRADLLVGGRVLRNTGTQFVDETASRTPGPVDFSVAGDLDGDGDPDVLGTSYLDTPKLWINQNGIFVDATALALPAISTFGFVASLFDVDGDGDLDAFLIQGQSLSGTQALQAATVFRNDGTGRLLQQVQVAPFPVMGLQNYVTPVDLEADGDLDLVTQGTTANLLLGNGSGAFRQAFPNLGTGVAADMNGDGRPDLLRSEGIELRFAPQRSVLRPWIGGTAAVNGVDQIGDIDGDGDLDVCDPRVWRNDGTGNLTLDPTAGPFTLGSCLLADLDGDGDADLVSVQPDTTRYAVNNGAGQFGAVTTLQANTSFMLGASAGDADADGDVDLAITSVIAPSRILLNQGAGTFATLLLPTATGTSTRVNWLDLRGNGQIDLVATGSSGPRVYRVIAGAVVDVTATMAPAGLSGLFLVVGDVDLDGDTDLVGNALYRHDGAGNYTAEALGTGSSGVRQLIDLDGDGDLDLGPVLINRERQLSLPIEAHIGRPLRVELVAAPGRAQGEIAVLALSLTRLTPPLASPIGQLHLASLDALWPVALPNVDGLARIDLPVPNVPAIVGLELFLQALHSGSAGLGLGNVVSTTIE
ncbi:MAG: VCBS repeat-containing protein [Planctomycetes bacterium]|nr:VCBS repeat-containing protein [Planctomycetota bacterium]